MPFSVSCNSARVSGRFSGVHSPEQATNITIMRKSHLQNNEENNTTSESEFAFTIARVAVAQICQSMGFKGAQTPALEALTDIATRYLEEIAKVAAAAANSAGRTESNVADVMAALVDLAAVRGFLSSSDVRSPPCSSAVIKDLISFVKYADEIPFAQPLRWKRIHVCQGPKGNFLKCRGECGNDGKWYGDGGGGGSRHVPRWLPAVPAVEVEEKRAAERKEEKWGCMEGGVDREENGRCLDAGEERVGNNGIEGLEKRGKVRFKMGIGIGNPGIVGNLRVVGNGKRIWCE